MSATRRLARLEEARTAAALAHFRAAWWRYVERPRPPRYETAVAAHEARWAAQPPEERADGERVVAALEALIEPATPPQGIARAAAVCAAAPDLALPPGAPAYLVLAALAQLFDTFTDEAELAILAPPGADA